MQFDQTEIARLDIPDESQLRARLDQLIRPGGVELQPGDSYEASDPTGSIFITVNSSRLVTNVRIRPGWNGQIPPAAFPGALYSTYVTAVQRALAVALTHRAGPGPSASTSDGGEDTSELSLDEWVSRMRSRLNAIDDEYDAIRRRQQEGPSTEVVEVRSPLGYLTMRVRGGGPVEITGDPRALDNPSDTVLSQDAQQLFARAGLGVDQAESPRPAQPRRSRAEDDDYFSGFNVFGNED